MLTRLSNRVTVQEETRVLFQAGTYTSSWSTVCITWANVQLKTGDAGFIEKYDQSKKQQYNYYNVIIRYNESVTNKNRLLFKGKILVIESVADNASRNRLQTLKCREEVI